MLWEYKTIKIESKGLFKKIIDEEKLQMTINDLGLHGWELISTANFAAHYGGTAFILCFFKRSK